MTFEKLKTMSGEKLWRSFLILAFILTVLLFTIRNVLFLTDLFNFLLSLILLFFFLFALGYYLRGMVKYGNDFFEQENKLKREVRQFDSFFGKVAVAFVFLLIVHSFTKTLYSRDFEFSDVIIAGIVIFLVYHFYLKRKIGKRTLPAVLRLALFFLGLIAVILLVLLFILGEL